MIHYSINLNSTSKCFPFTIIHNTKISSSYCSRNYKFNAFKGTAAINFNLKAYGSAVPYMDYSPLQRNGSGDLPLTTADPGMEITTVFLTANNVSLEIISQSVQNSVNSFATRFFGSLMSGCILTMSQNHFGRIKVGNSAVFQWTQLFN